MFNEYEKRLQSKLFKIFSKEFYQNEEIAEKLNVNLNTAKELTKNLKYFKHKGYERNAIVLICMQGILR